MKIHLEIKLWNVIEYFIGMWIWPSKTIFSWWCQCLNFTQNDIYGIFRCLKWRRHLRMMMRQPKRSTFVMIKTVNLIEWMIKLTVKNKKRSVFMLIHYLPLEWISLEPMRRFSLGVSLVTYHFRFISNSCMYVYCTK
jgi:hypothetical protein